jgi:hypothetical protein
MYFYKKIQKNSEIYKILIDIIKEKLTNDCIT